MIVETEAYGGIVDRASHAYGNRRTRRTEIMFQAGGVAYVYLCYGLHCLFNIVTNNKGFPDAVLIRALEPVAGIDYMLKRRRKGKVDRSLTGGPGALTQALGIGLRHTGVRLDGQTIWLQDGAAFSLPEILAGPRIGIQYAGADAKRPWRFRVRRNPWTSPVD